MSFFPLVSLPDIGSFGADGISFLLVAVLVVAALGGALAVISSLIEIGIYALVTTLAVVALFHIFDFISVGNALELFWTLLDFL